LHPDDALEQLQNIYAALVPSGIYICITPNRFAGPHDISKYFDEIASGFHLKEYTFSELRRMFREVGFLEVKAYIGIKGRYMRISNLLIIIMETVLSGIPYSVRTALTYRRPFRQLLNIRIVGVK